MNGHKLRVAAVLAAALLVVGLGTLTGGVNAGDGGAISVLRNAAGNPVANVRLTQGVGTVLVRAVVHDLDAGFHGFHVHAVGTCTAPSFTSAGGHLGSAPGTIDHPNHPADMPVLLVNSDGTGEARFKTDRFDVADVIGKALIIHAKPDNYANVPLAVGQGGTTTAAQLYSPATTGTGNDTATGLTNNTGNAGARIACGVINPAGS
jgi:Cu-Zn family superoxide dismutase